MYDTGMYICAILSSAQNFDIRRLHLVIKLMYTMESILRNSDNNEIIQETVVLSSLASVYKQVSERTVRYLSTDWVLVMFGRFQVRFWAKSNVRRSSKFGRNVRRTFRCHKKLLFSYLTSLQCFICVNII